MLSDVMDMLDDNKDWKSAVRSESKDEGKEAK